MYPPASRRSAEARLARAGFSRSRRCAFWLMLLGAAFEVAAAFVAVKTANSLVPVFARHDPSDAGVIAAAHGQTLQIEDMVAAVFWLVMAFLNRSALGDGPRICSVLLFYCGTQLSWQYLHEPNSRPTQAVTVAIWLIGLTVILLMFSDKLSSLSQATLRWGPHARSGTANP
jgi:hypothetical protein